jgi:Protein of unknown function (DUF732)
MTATDDDQPTAVAGDRDETTTGIGPSDDPGTAPTPSETETEHVYAWSLDDGDEPRTEGEGNWRSWLMWAGLVALVCATVAAAVWFSMTFYFEEWARPSASASVSSPPAAAPAPKPPPPSAAPAPPLSAAPAPQAAPPPPPPGDALVSVLRQMDVPFADKPAAVTDALAVCGYLKGGHHKASELLYQYEPELWPDLTQKQRDDFGGAAIGIYCPQYWYLFKPGVNDDDHATS